MKDFIHNGINYGALVLNKLDGVIFATDAMYSSMLNLPVIEVGEVTKFNNKLHLSTTFETSQREVMHYIFNNNDVRKLAVALSMHTGLMVRVVACARILATYRNGQLMGEVRTLDSFYTSITPEERIDTMF